MVPESVRQLVLATLLLVAILVLFLSLRSLIPQWGSWGLVLFVLAWFVIAVAVVWLATLVEAIKVSLVIAPLLVGWKLWKDIMDMFR
jgi:hypothetical protein